MPCPVCLKIESDHRPCVLELFKTDKIQSIKEWEEMSKPKKRRIIKAMIPLEQTK